jgi:hypothetical protein
VTMKCTVPTVPCPHGPVAVILRCALSPSSPLNYSVPDGAPSVPDGAPDFMKCSVPVGAVSPSVPSPSVPSPSVPSPSVPSPSVPLID